MPRKQTTEELMTGLKYSQLLIDRTREELKDSRDGMMVTDEDVAKALGITRTMISYVKNGEKPFGRLFFERHAAKQGQLLADFLRDLIRWKISKTEERPPPSDRMKVALEEIIRTIEFNQFPEKALTEATQLRYLCNIAKKALGLK